MTSPTKSVAIIGGGPAGLVAAKTLLAHLSSAFRVVVFEQHERVGGMWAVSPSTNASSSNSSGSDSSSNSNSNSNSLADSGWQPKCSAQMRTNLSRFTVAFSDFSWDTVDVQTKSVPMFPAAWQVGRYLEAYARRFIPAEALRLRCRVEGVERVDLGTRARWKLKWKALPEEKVQEEVFDYLLVASGFFATPKPLDLAVPALSTGSEGLRCKHSSRVGSLADILLPSAETVAGGTIVVVGGSMSGVEASANVAMQLSDAVWSTQEKQHSLGTLTVTHVTKRPAYVLPRYIPHLSAPTPTFIPVDLALYDLGRRAPGPVTFALGLTTQDRAAQTHSYLDKVTGGDALTNGSEQLRHTDTDKTEAAYVAINDSYDGFVHAGLIKPVRGAAVAIEQVEGTASVRIERADADGEVETTTVQNVVAIVYATGFSPRSSVAYIPQAVREELEADLSCDRIPFILHDTISHPSNPSLAFVGFYDGPFWGVMEMQARAIADRWANDSTKEPESDPSAGSGSRRRRDSQGMEAISELQAIWSMRAAMKRGDPSVPQYTLGDYVGLVEKFASALDIKRLKIDDADDDRTGSVAPARYPVEDKVDGRAEVEIALKDLGTMYTQAVKSTRFIAAAAFAALAGPWKLERNLSSRLPEFPSGDFIGRASFHPRMPTGPEFDHEYLYVEEGTLKTLAGFELKATRRYVYRYSAAKDELSAWFVKEDAKSADYLFHVIKFDTPRASNEGNKTSAAVVTAQAFHHCSPDDYTAAYEFRFRGAALESFSISYDVKGPKKDYVTNARYSRQ